jgi:hypothetical protein
MRDYFPVLWLCLQGVYNPHYMFFWSQITIFFSQLWAVYVLVMLYSQVSPHDRLIYAQSRASSLFMLCGMQIKVHITHLKPLGKFLTIKCIVFFSFWYASVLRVVCVEVTVLQNGSSDV